MSYHFLAPRAEADGAWGRHAGFRERAAAHRECARPVPASHTKNRAEHRIGGEFGFQPLPCLVERGADGVVGQRGGRFRGTRRGAAKRNLKNVVRQRPPISLAIS